MFGSRHFLLSMLAVGSLGAVIQPPSASAQVTIGYENNGADPWMVSQSLGFFQKMIPGGIKLVYFDSGPAAMSALASNSLQFMCGIGVPPFVAGVSQGLPLAIIFNQERYTSDAGIVVRPSAGINSVSELAGKKIAIVQGSQASFELGTFLDEARVPFDDVRQINMSPPEMRVAWETKSINAAIVWDPVFGTLVAAGAKILKTDTDLPADASSYNLCIADTNWVKAHPEATVGFVKALNAGVTFSKQNPQKALALMAKAAGIDASTAAMELKGYQIFSAADQSSPAVLGEGAGIGQSDTTRTLNNTATVLIKIGRITSPLSNAASAVDPEFAIQAAK